MKTQRFLLIALLLSTLLLISSCASSLCRDLRKGVDESVLLPLVIENPRPMRAVACSGEALFWKQPRRERGP